MDTYNGMSWQKGNVQVKSYCKSTAFKSKSSRKLCLTLSSQVMSEVIKIVIRVQVMQLKSTSLQVDNAEQFKLNADV